jgi:hypothetical protein
MSTVHARMIAELPTVHSEEHGPVFFRKEAV